MLEDCAFLSVYVGPGREVLIGGGFASFRERRSQNRCQGAVGRSFRIAKL